MNNRMRGALASLVMGASMMATTAAAQDKAALTTEKDKVSYAVGLDVARSFESISQDIDLAVLRRAVDNAFAGGEPLQPEEQAQSVHTALQMVVAVRSGQRVPGMAPGSEPKMPPKDEVSMLVGDRMVGPSLEPLKDDLDLDVMFQALHTVFAGDTPLLSEQEAMASLQAFMGRKQQAAAEKNLADGAAFLAANRTQDGVISTPSGLQYKVLREGSGPRPMPGERVRVNYEGKLLDGTVFDSSYERGQPAEFGLDQVIAGWTEGVALMPVGAKYRFWIPSELAYGTSGAPGGKIGPNAALTFDIELLGVAP